MLVLFLFCFLPLSEDLTCSSCSTVNRFLFSLFPFSFFLFPALSLSILYPVLHFLLSSCLLVGILILLHNLQKNQFKFEIHAQCLNIAIFKRTEVLKQSLLRFLLYNSIEYHIPAIYVRIFYKKKVFAQRNFVAKTVIFSL